MGGSGMIQSSRFDKAVINHIYAKYNLNELHRELLCLILDGYSNSEIAAKLDLARGTVATRTWRLYKGLGTSGRMETYHLAHDVERMLCAEGIDGQS